MKIINKAVMTVTGLVLIATAGLKVHMMVTEPIVSKGFWESWLFFMIQIPLVTGLGIWMISGLFRKAAWLVGVAALIVFLADTLYKGFSGAQSCGCFGSVDVDPWVTLFAFNLPFLAAMLIFRPKDEKLLPPPWPNPVYWCFVGVITAAVLAGTITFMAFNRIEPKIVDLTGTLRAGADNLDNGKEADQPPIGEQTQPQNNNILSNSETDIDAEAKEPEQDNQTGPSEQEKNQDQQTNQTQVLPDNKTDENVGNPEAIKNTESVNQDPDHSLEPVNEQSSSSDKEDQTKNAEESGSQAKDENIEPVELDAEKRALLGEMLNHVDILDKLNTGLSVAFFYHDSCPTCADLVPEYSAGLEQFGENMINLAFIDIPGGGSAPDPVPEDTLAYTGNLRPRQKGQKWVIGTPLVMVLMDGEVQLAWQLQVPGFDAMLDAAFSQ